MSDGGIIEQEVYVVGPARRPMMEPFTPRLRQDRRSQARLSAWKAPSFDESLGTLFFSRQNRQIVLFCLGFILPFGMCPSDSMRINLYTNLYLSMDAGRFPPLAP